MKYRKLGRTNFDVSEIGYGAWGIGGTMWIGASDKESLAALRYAIELGVNLIDTALVYGNGHSEELVGRVVADAPGKVYIATKVPPKNRIWPAPAGVGIEEAFPHDYIVRCTEESLRNLGVETIDLQQLHVWSPEWLDSDEFPRALEDLKSQGKVRAFGISINDHQPDTALGIIETGLIDTVQVIYNIFDQSPERNLFPACIRHNIGVLARVPLDEGALTGRITEKTTFPEGDFRNFYFRDDRKKQVAERVAALVRDLNLEDASHLPGIAIRFCLSHPAVSTVIPGMRSKSSVEANAMASGQGPLPPAMLEILRRHAWDRNYYK
ncbi:MAG: aldo/keto reductase [Bryobacteraceae bacterium]|jgi:aryl-alcohol dehydrogenase-like predicted oxidoreductase